MTFDITNTPVLSVLYIIPLLSGTPSLVHVELGVGLPVTLVNAVMVASIPVTTNTSLGPRMPSGGAIRKIFYMLMDVHACSHM